MRGCFRTADSGSTLKIQTIFICFLRFTFCWILSHLCTHAQPRGWLEAYGWIGASIVSTEHACSFCQGYICPTMTGNLSLGRAVGSPAFLSWRLSLKPTRLPRVGFAYCPRSRDPLSTKAEKLLHTSGSSLLGAGGRESEQP